MYYQQIDGWFDYSSWFDEALNKYPNGVLVEIGIWLGKSICYMAEVAKNRGINPKIYAVDHWKGSEEVAHQDFITRIGGTDQLYETFLKNMEHAGVKDIIIPIRMDSIEASKQFEDKSIDFVFIDADHHYENIKRDILEWLPKVKDGGMIGGHDYTDNPHAQGVVQAVKEIFGNSFQVKHNSWIKYL